MTDIDIKTDTKTDPTIDKIRWQNRRRMAWTSLSSIIVFTGLIFFTDLVPVEKLKVLTEVITWYYFSCATVIGAYMGFTTYASVKGVK